MIMTKKELLEERRLMDYTLLVTENLFREMYIILSELDQKTRSARITQTEVEYKGCKKFLIQERELSTKELRAELEANNLIRTMEYVKSSLDVTDHLEYSDNQILDLLDTLPHIDTKHYFKTLLRKENSSLLTTMLSLQELIKRLRDCGYGKPEQYNQLFYFIVRQSINTLKKILEG
jgi:hypothetical protein